MQIGHPAPGWPLALLKEFVDNARNSCEEGSVTPRIDVTVEAGAFAVRDNGPGIPPEVIAGALDYSTRVSSKAYYVSPTRGQLGHALKCLWAAPFVASGDRGLVEVTTQSVHHRIEVTLDRIAQKPHLEHSTGPGDGKSGTLVKVHWPEVASSLVDGKSADFYGAELLVRAYAAFNLHATF